MEKFELCKTVKAREEFLENDEASLLNPKVEEKY